MAAEAHSRIDCPKCGKSMAQVRVDEITVDRCSACGGLFLDLFEKEQLLKEHRSRLDELDSGRGPAAEAAVMTCPRDGSRMIRLRDTQQSHVEIEMCQICGAVFLDAGELKDLSRHTLRERAGRFFKSHRL